MIEWYYVADNQRIGPITSAEMPQLVQQGVIKSDTLIWRHGMPEWITYATMCGQPPKAAPAAAAPAAPAQPVTQQPSPIQPATHQPTSIASVAAATSTPTPESPAPLPAALAAAQTKAHEPTPIAGAASAPLPAALSAAQSPFENNSRKEPLQASPSAAGPSKPIAKAGKKLEKASVELTSVTITPDNKARVIQEILEGIDDTGKDWEYAGFWLRFLANSFDGILCSLCVFGAGILAGILGTALGSFGGILVVAVQLLGPTIYFVYSMGSSAQATPGKRMLNMRVIRANGEDITYGTAFARLISQYVSSLCFMLGYICAAFDPEKRTMHDRMCDTRIIRTT